MLLIEKGSTPDEMICMVNKFNRSNKIAFYCFQLIFTVLSIIFLELFDIKSKILFFAYPIVLIILSHEIFAKYYNWIRSLILADLTDEEQKEFIGRTKRLKRFSTRYFVSSLIVFFIVFGSYFEFVKMDTQFNGEVIKYGVVTSLSTDRGRNPHSIWFEYYREHKKESGFTTVLYFEGEYRTSYGFPVQKRDEYAVLCNRRRDWGAIMDFNIPSPNQTVYIKESLIWDNSVKRDLVEAIYKQYQYKGLLAYYHYIHPGWLKKIDRDHREELQRIIDDDDFKQLIKK
jgi:hypothetical protein